MIGSCEALLTWLAVGRIRHRTAAGRCRGVGALYSALACMTRRAVVVQDKQEGQAHDLRTSKSAFCEQVQGLCRMAVGLPSAVPKADRHRRRAQICRSICLERGLCRQEATGHSFNKLPGISRASAAPRTHQRRRRQEVLSAADVEAARRQFLACGRDLRHLQ